MRWIALIWGKLPSTQNSVTTRLEKILAGLEVKTFTKKGQKAVKMTEYYDAFPRFILVESTKIRFPASNNDICIELSQNLYHWIPDILTNIKHMHNMV